MAEEMQLTMKLTDGEVSLEIIEANKTVVDFLAQINNNFVQIVSAVNKLQEEIETKQNTIIIDTEAPTSETEGSDGDILIVYADDT